MMGGGRTVPTQAINYTTGFNGFCQVGDKVDTKTPICYVHSEDEDILPEIRKVINDAIQITESKPKSSSVILSKIS